MTVKVHTVKHFTYLIDNIHIDTVVLGYSLEMVMGVCTLFYWFNRAMRQDF